MLLFFVVLIAFTKSQSVKKYPPVVAFRKGIETHHFGKNRLPLEKTKSNVHLRLALKGFFSNTKQNIGIGACIAISTVAIVISFVLFAFCSDDYNTFNAVCGLDIADLRVNINPNADLYEIRDDLLNYEEVRKVNITDNWFVEKLQYQDTPIFPIVYDDYEDTESIFTCEGRFPKHDNEVMITKINSAMEGLTVGDTINIKVGKIEKPYIVYGMMINSWLRKEKFRIA